MVIERSNTNEFIAKEALYEEKGGNERSLKVLIQESNFYPSLVMIDV